MSVTNRRRKRRSDAMNYAYSGPFSAVLNPIRTLPLTKERYTPDSPESYTIGDAQPVLREMLDRVRPKRRRRGRRGGRRVEA